MEVSGQKTEITLFWFRRDLRLEDNTALFYALKENKNVLPIFIYDTQILSQLEEVYDRRVDYIHQALNQIQSKLHNLGTSLKIFHTRAEEAFKVLLDDYTLKSVYCNRDYEPAAIERDKNIEDILLTENIPFKTYKDQCIFDRNDVLKDDGSPYTIFTPYSRKWKTILSAKDYTSYNTQAYFSNFHKHPSHKIPSLETLGFRKTDIVLPEKISVTSELIQNYKDKRDIPSINGTSRLSMHLRFGTVSIRSLVTKAVPLSETWLNELIWREFYMMILYHFPHVEKVAFKKKYEAIVWRNNEAEFKKWCEGKTGFPIVDAGMRELNATGFMHNRVRMIVSSFLVKDLLIEWRWGEVYFANKLNDFDLSANNGGWQWAAGTGCDAAPYFRIFNPTEQQKRFDPEFNYIKKWIPEFGTTDYPEPMVNHAEARLRTLAVYKKALIENKQLNLL